MVAATKTRSPLAARPNCAYGRRATHRVPVCPETGLPRYRDRQQARDAARATHVASSSGTGMIAALSIDAALIEQPQPITHTFACRACRGFHVDEHMARVRLQPVPNPPRSSKSTAAFLASLTTRKRRYVLVDIENLTDGAKATRAEVQGLWAVLREQAPGISPRDHVVIGAGRGVARRYEPLIQGENVRWVVGDQAVDGADEALLAAVDLHAVARQYDELVIASGDHVFADLARRATALGLTVQVVVLEGQRGRSKLARSLAAEATTRTVVRRTSRSDLAARRDARATATTAMAGAVHIRTVA